MSQKKALDAAFKLYHNKDFKKALTAFDGIISDDETPSWVKVRVKQFQQIAANQVTPPEVDNSATLKTISALLNEQRYNDAEELLDTVELDPGAKEYLRSEIKIEKGEKETALELLKKSVELDSKNIGYALHSPSFTEFLQDEEFQFLRSEKEEETAD